MVPTLIMLALVLMSQPAAGAPAATIRISDYWVSRGVGDSSTYRYLPPISLPDFTVTITLITTGYYANKYRIGDTRSPDGTTYYQIVSWDNNFFYLYYDSKHNTTYNPPAQIPITQPLETLVPNPANSATGFWYFKKLAVLTVPAGTYYNILLKIDLDSQFPRNSANSYFGLPDSIPYGVTHADWSAYRVGIIQDMDFDAANGTQGPTYVLKSTNARPWGKSGGGLLFFMQ
jgi:hypothetical protein